uniref:Short-chain type dehydrogenase/reductase n=1 Tax=Noccaea caerulescens TaxID=107243 RepID=A0A1J3I1B2_NOCCA
MAAQSSSISQPPLPLAGRVAIVTGSSRGIGRAIAIHLAELGARIVVNYTSKSADAERVAAEINDLPAREEITGKGPRAIVVQANVSEPSQVKSLFDAAESAFESPVHIMVNSAGILDAKYPTVADTTVEDFDRTFSVNTKGSFLCSKEAANRLKKGGGGRIILVTSSVTRSLKPGFAAYAASKAAVETMAKILAKELKGTGITANCVSPGPIATEMFYDGKSTELVEKIAAESPFGRVGEVKDVVPLVGFLAGDGGEWVNGQIIPVNGGYA